MKTNALNARAVAYRILKSARVSATYSNIAVDKALGGTSLCEADKSLVTAIVMGVTERRLTLDYITDRLARDPDGIDGETRVLIEMGIYQLMYLDRIPEYAAVNETVDLAPRRSRGFVNAILRSFLRLKSSGGVEGIFPDKSDAEKYLSVKFSFPEEFCRKFIEIYGRERTEKIFDIFNSAPDMTLRINTLKISREEYAALLDEKGIEYILSSRLENAMAVRGVAYSSLPGACEGFFFVQDEASQMCVEALGARSGELVVDACSCPGSKSFGSAIGMGNEGEILSFDLHKSKLSLVDSGAARLGINIIKTDVRDGRELCESLVGRADRVLCDVPCSGLGVVAKKPEIRYKKLDELERLPEIQYAILENCSKYVKEDGFLVYSTCTVLPCENEDNVRKFLSEHGEFEAVEFTVGGKESRGGMMSLSPDVDGTDGFFVAKMKRRKITQDK